MRPRAPAARGDVTDWPVGGGDNASRIGQTWYSRGQLDGANLTHFLSLEILAACCSRPAMLHLRETVSNNALKAKQRLTLPPHGESSMLEEISNRRDI